MFIQLLNKLESLTNPIKEKEQEGVRRKAKASRKEHEDNSGFSSDSVDELLNLDHQEHKQKIVKDVCVKEPEKNIKSPVKKKEEKKTRFHDKEDEKPEAQKLVTPVAAVTKPITTKCKICCKDLNGFTVENQCNHQYHTDCLKNHIFKYLNDGRKELSCRVKNCGISMTSTIIK
jgi:hypothetical protein